MSKIKDVFALLNGQDLEEEPVKKASTKKSDEPKKATRKDRATDAARFAAFDYAHTDQLGKDIQEALKTGSLSPDLEKLLQVLFDKESVRTLVSAQGGVCPPPPGPDDYYLESRFVHPDSGDWCNEQAQALLDSGMKLDDLCSFNIELRVVRKRKLDDEEIGEGNEDDYREIKAKLAAATAKAT